VVLLNFLSSVANPGHFGTDPDPRIRTSYINPHPLSLIINLIFSLFYIVF
jgi:hypothetical protein